MHRIHMRSGGYSSLGFPHHAHAVAHVLQCPASGSGLVRCPFIDRTFQASGENEQGGHDAKRDADGQQ